MDHHLSARSIGVIRRRVGDRRFRIFALLVPSIYGSCLEVRSVPMRFRRSVSLGKAVRLSVSKTGFGMSVGGAGARYSVHTSGRTTRTVGITGSGVSFVSTSAGGAARQRSSGGRSRREVVALPPQSFAAVLPRPGMFSGKAEKRYHEGVHAYLRGDHQVALRALEETLALDPSALSAHLIAAICVGKLDRPDQEQISHLEALITSDAAMPDRLQSKYLPSPPGVPLASGPHHRAHHR